MEPPLASESKGETVERQAVEVSSLALNRITGGGPDLVGSCNSRLRLGVTK